MKQNLFNKLWLRVGMIVAIMTTALSGTAWAETITFSELGLENGVQYLDPFDGGDFTVTFAGGANDGKYYTTGSGIRVYAGGTMTIAAEGTKTLSKIVITYDGSNKPTSNEVVDAGTYNYETGTWTGEASEVVFTRPSGSGHWRVKSITVTYTTSGGGDTPGESGKATLTQSNLELGSYTTNTSKTIDGITYIYTDLMKSNENIQAKASTGTIKNTTAYSGDIISVAITHYGTARPTTINGSADGTNWTQVATGNGSITADFAGKGYKYFQITRGSNVAYWEKIEITYSTSSNPVCDMPTFTPGEGTYLFAQDVTISTATEGATIYYTTDGSNPTINSTQYNGAINVSTPTTIKAIAVADGYDNSTVASATYTIVPLEHAGTQADPYTVADAFTAIDANAGITGVYVSGIVCTAANSLTNNKYLTYYISDDGTTTNKLEAYHGLGIGGADFTSADDIQKGDKVVIYGNLTKYNNTTYEFAEGNQLVSIVHPASITVASTTINASCAVNNGTINVTYKNFTTVLSEVIFCDVNGNDATYDWITAVINNENNVEYHLNENAGEARTAYMKVYALDDETNDVYSDLITINQAAYVAPYEAQDGVFDFVEAAAANYDYGSGVGTSESYIYDDKTWTAGNVTLVTSGRYRWWPNDKTLRFYGEDENSTKASAMVISVPSGKVITSIKITGGTNFSADCGEYASGSWTGCSQSVTLTYAATSGSVNVKTVTVTYVDGYTTIKLNASGYATFSSNNAVSIPENGDFTAWQITNIDSDNKITFVQVTGNVAAETGLFLKGDKNAEITIEVAASGEELSGNKLVGFPNATNVADNEYYGLSGNQFVKVTAGTVKAGKALLPAGYITESNGVKPFTFIFEEDDATAIEMVNGQSSMVNGSIYNLAGQRISKMQKGINIVNGKKILR